MNIRLVHIKVRDLFNGYQDNGDKGVVAYGGKLDVRPAYQREFVYKPEQQQAVIDTLSKGYPLNVMYWADHGNGHYELIDGQQRTLSICTFLDGDFSCAGLFGIKQPQAFHSLPEDRREQLLDYELTVYICDGTESEKLEWFKTINIAGEELTDQELRNAVYTGPWVSDAKRYFYHENTYNPKALEQEVATLMADEDVTKKRGIYKYVLEKAIGNDDPSVLGIRAFSDSQKRTVYEQQGGICTCCGKKYKYEEMEGDHIKPWSKGGKTEIENLQMLCRDCNRRKSNK